MEWTPYEQGNWHKQSLPPERKNVLCLISPKPDKGMPHAIVVGYLRFAAGDKRSPVFVTPGISGTVEGWCDCLFDDVVFPKPPQ